MGLKETIEETKKQLIEVTEKEAEEEKSALEELNKKVEEPREEKTEEPKTEAKAEEDKPEEAKTDAEQREARIAKKREKDRLADELAAAQARIAALEAEVKKPAIKEISKDDVEPDINTNPVEWTAWTLRQQEKKIESLAGWKAEQEAVRAKESQVDRAKREVADFENALRPSAPDYDEVKNWYAGLIGASIRIVNPDIPNDQLHKAIETRLLTRASELLNKGYENPIEAMYLEAKALGGPPKKQVEEKEGPKPDMDKVAKLRNRNAGMAGASGAGGDEADLTPLTATKLTNAQFAKLKPEQKKRLLASLR